MDRSRFSNKSLSASKQGPVRGYANTDPLAVVCITACAAPEQCIWYWFFSAFGYVPRFAGVFARSKFI